MSNDEVSEEFNNNVVCEVVIEELKQLPSNLFVTGKLYYCDDLTIKKKSSVLHTP